MRFAWLKFVNFSFWDTQHPTPGHNYRPYDLICTYTVSNTEVQLATVAMAAIKLKPFYGYKLLGVVARKSSDCTSPW